MDVSYDTAQSQWLDRLRKRNREVLDGICMARLTSSGEILDGDCAGPLGSRHAISKRHLRLIADAENIIRANKEYVSFTQWPAKNEALLHVPISQFSASKWSCQKHDERFAGIDAKTIDLQNSENLFKAVYRVVLHQCHLLFARWHAFCAETKTEADWELFKKTAFDALASEKTASDAAHHWKSAFLAVLGKKKSLEQRLIKRSWASVDFRAIRLQCEPMVAGWSCMMKKRDYSELEPRLGQPSVDPIELGYMIVIPQDYGQAIITACEGGNRIWVPEIASIHDCMPACTDPNEPIRAGAVTRRRISKRIWELNELGIRESVYRNWSKTERVYVQKWMKDRGRLRRIGTGPSPRDLPKFF